MNNPVRPVKQAQKTRIVRDSNRVALVDQKGNKLAQFKVWAESDQSVRITNWKAYKKGQGYGKELIKKYVASKPNLFFITTDGLSKAGQYNIEKALPNFRVILLGGLGGRGISNIMRQDAIDNYVENQEYMDNRRIRRPIWVDPKFHSRNKK
jgi:hypothetical protein